MHVYEYDSDVSPQDIYKHQRTTLPSTRFETRSFWFSQLCAPSELARGLLAPLSFNNIQHDIESTCAHEHASRG